MAETAFQATFVQLKQLLEPFADRLILQQHTPSVYTLNTPHIAQFNKDLLFGSVQIRKNYVSYYLMPVYVAPALLDGVSPALKKRMQGKSCFNFTTLDPALRDELAQLTQRGFDHFVQAYAI